MKIVADERIAALDESFGRCGDLVSLPGRRITKQHLLDADALLTRTVTRVDRALTEGTTVRFVGTATIGTDHMDTRYLDHQGIRWAAAPGCNADATAQYTLAHFLLACQRLSRNPLSQRFGIVGCGNVGSRLRRLLESLGIEVIACDPPLEARGEPGFSSMEEIYQCDVVSLHVPLTHGGRWPTHHLFNAQSFSRLGPGKLLINACRGDVLEAASLIKWIEGGGHAALDVWPHEPEIDPQLIEMALVATPHIAGYSLDGKLRATSMIFEQFCQTFNLQGYREITPSEVPELDLQALEYPDLEQVILQVCPVERDDRAMRRRMGISGIDRIREYDALRSHYPERRDFACWRLLGKPEAGLESRLQKLGFSITNH